VTASALADAWNSWSIFLAALLAVVATEVYHHFK